MTAGEYKFQIAEILKAAARIGESIRGITREDFLGDSNRLAGARDEIARIGRAVDRLPEMIRRRYPAIDWGDWAADVLPGDDTLWDSAKRQVPAFAEQVNRILFDITD